jgi:hypothetical protein
MLPAPCSVQIHVKDQSGADVSNAVVTVGRGSAWVDSGLTDKLGRYQVLLGAGEFVLHIQQVGFEAFSKDLSEADCAATSAKRVDAILQISRGGMVEIATAVNLPLESAAVPNHLELMAPSPFRQRLKRRLKRIFAHPNND